MIGPKTTSYAGINLYRNIEAVALVFFVILNIEALYSQNFWENPYSTQSASVYCITPSGDNLFAGLASAGGLNGVILSTDNGLTWNITGLRKTDILSIGVSSSSVVYAGTIQKGVYRSFDNGNTWDAIGPTNETVYSITFSPDKSIIIGTANDGIFKSTDNGLTWSNMGMQSSQINAMAFDTSGTLFACANTGLYTLKKNDVNWIRTSNLNASISSIFIDSSKNIFIGTDVRGLLLSTDGGKVWNTINNGLQSTNVTSVVVNAFGNIFAGTADQGVFRSPDYGQSWQKLITGMSTFSIKTLALNIRGFLFAGTLTGEIYKSIKNTSGGVKPSTPLLSYPPDGSTGISTNVSPSWKFTAGADSYTLQIGDNSAFTGSNVTTYQVYDTIRLLTGLAYITKYYWRVNALNSDNVASAWSNTWSFTTEGAPKVFWQFVGGPNRARGFFSNKKNSIYTCTPSEGMFFSGNDGLSWGSLYSFGGSIYCFAHDSTNRLFCGIGPGGLLYSINDGGTWYSSTLYDDDIHSILVLPRGDIIAGGVREIYRSTDQGLTWSKADVGSGVITSLTLEKSSGNIYTGTHGDGVFVSRDNGTHWTNTGFPNDVIINILFDTKGILYAATEDSGVYRSTNSGTSWSSIFYIPSTPENYLTGMVITPNDRIYLGYSQEGVFQSLDYGKSWSNLATGLTSKWIYSLGIDYDGYIYAGTFYNGIHRSVNTFLVSVKKYNTNIPDGYSLGQNYPNPFNPKTTIQYSVPIQGDVKIDLFDALGRHVKTIVNQRQDAGNYITDIDASGLTSGIYYYVMKAGSFSKANKFILMK